jgi:hypothetical protein
MREFGYSTQVEANGDTTKTVTYYWKFNGMKIHAYCVSNTPEDTSLPYHGTVSISVDHELVKILETNNDYIDAPDYIQGIVEKWMKKYY